MGSTDHTMDAYVEMPQRKSGGGFVVLALLGLLGGAFVLAYRQAPILSADPYNWVLWARGDRLWAGLVALALVFTAIGIIGWFASLFAPSAPKAKASKAKTTSPAKTEAYPAPSVAPAMPALALDDTLSIPASMARPLTDHTVAATFEDEPAPQLFGQPPMVEIRSLEPAVFHDNASDSFLSQNPVTASVATPIEAAPVSAQVIPLRPEFAPEFAPEKAPEANPAATPEFTIAAAQPAHDPLEAALLADGPSTPSPAPQADMNAVIASAMHFAASDEVTLKAPEPFVPPVGLAAAAVQPAEVQPTTPLTDVAPSLSIVTEDVAVATPVQAEPPVADAQTEIRQAVQMALSVWPDATRAIAGDELSVRIAKLYYDAAPESANAFHHIATGDLKAAANAIMDHANALASQGRNSEAAEQWRIIGALNMGRDDGRALAAYEKVSELDAADSNIHLYLSRRYQMAGETGKMLPVLGRALAVISDPQTRAELLTPYADLKMKAGDARAAGDAFEELSRLHETTTNLKPDDMGARSTYAVTLARLAQAREVHGAFDVAGQAYKKAYTVFADLSARKPDHPGLRVMADNALKDAQRFNQG